MMRPSLAIRRRSASISRSTRAMRTAARRRSSMRCRSTMLRRHSSWSATTSSEIQTSSGAWRRRGIRSAITPTTTGTCRRSGRWSSSGRSSSPSRRSTVTRPGRSLQNSTARRRASIPRKISKWRSSSAITPCSGALPMWTGAGRSADVGAGLCQAHPAHPQRSRCAAAQHLADKCGHPRQSAHALGGDGLFVR